MLFIILMAEKNNLGSDDIQAALEKVIQGNVSLEYVLFNQAHSQG